MSATANVFGESVSRQLFDQDSMVLDVAIDLQGNQYFASQQGTRSSVAIWDASHSQRVDLTFKDSFRPVSVDVQSPTNYLIASGFAPKENEAEYRDLGSVRVFDRVDTLLTAEPFQRTHTASSMVTLSTTDPQSSEEKKNTLTHPQG